MTPEEAITTVYNLRHRTDKGRHNCTCPECKAIKQVCALAREALAIKQSRKKDVKR